jgi:hypothetical protein
VLMHMPMRWGVVVIVAVAACVGAYYVLSVRPGRVDGWEIYQGSGRGAQDPGSDFRYLDVSYLVKHPSRPLFGYELRSRPSSAKPPASLVFEYQSEWPAVLLVQVYERDGSVYQARVELEHAEAWKRVSLDETRFALRTSPGNTDENRRLDFRQLSSHVDFYDGTGVAAPSTVFANRVKLTGPWFGLNDKPSPGTAP